MKAILILVFCTPLFIQAQVAMVNSQQAANPVTSHIIGEVAGIKWADNLNWQQVLKKAKKEKKYIFVDCYATWCGPCKKMDEEVYANDSVGDVFNAKFISVKLQMDSTKADNELKRTWYKTAKEMQTAYRIKEYPTFLFFSPDGEMVYKELGYKEPNNFIQVAQDATTPSKQYYALIRAYKKGKRDYVNMPNLITMSKRLGDTTNYRPLLTDYYVYLQSLSKDKLYTKENIEFIASTISKPSQGLFSMFYPDGKAVNELMKEVYYARKVADEVIFKEFANPFLSAAEGKPEPDWNILYATIGKDYKADYADRVVMEAQMRWYYFYQDMLKYATILNDKMERHGSDTTNKGDDFILNNQAFLIWEKVNDKEQLKRMIGWMAGVVRRGEKATDFYLEYWPLYIDTYANLLYKVGETQKAIKWQELAALKSKELLIDKGYEQLFQQKLEKMKKGEPTWPNKK